VPLRHRAIESQRRAEAKAKCYEAIFCIESSISTLVLTHLQKCDTCGQRRVVGEKSNKPRIAGR